VSGTLKFETKLSKEQFIRLSIWRHIQRKSFYFYAVTCAAGVAYAITKGATVLLSVVWIPFAFYLATGVFAAFWQSRDQNQPYFLPTHYEFSGQGVAVKTKQGSSQLEWDKFAGWKKIAKCYVLVLTAGPILAIPQAAVPVTQTTKFETLLRSHIGR